MSKLQSLGGKITVCLTNRKYWHLTIKRMVVFRVRGIELHVVLKTGNHIVLLNQTATDDRLLQSRWFAEQRKTWFDNLYQKSDLSTLIDVEDVIELTSEEDQVLQTELNKHLDNVDNYGWYDVISFSSTPSRMGYDLWCVLVGCSALGT